ncbi:MAG: DUF1634 domain-containing protein [Bacillota bacterium]
MSKNNNSSALDKSKPGGKVAVAPEQLKYANLLLYGSWLGIAILAVTFILYMTGVMPVYIEPSQMQQYWGMKASDYLDAAKIPHGWGWLKMISYGDFIPLLGIALLGLLTVVGYLILLPAYLKKKDGIYSVLVVLEVMVLLLAASGILGVGAH